ncbi:hypothetical protein OL239_08730 [Arthrobacter sp. ATA002]|uniref:hypothetical protein n=1 Tax=Arthrobacter sp. ATA002 TaxID=2991715 RepID=UPI0022A6A9A1|nr:hypothetical protein [Arthrobacter sp. ATA002]WAP53127.1 hypothetical protein OL239_08730 [Arthrobacter sp. ATA002]
MEIFWPGVIIGPILFTGCLIGFRKLYALSRVAGQATSQVVGKKVMDKFAGSPEYQKMSLIIPLFAGMATGVLLAFFGIFGSFFN